MSTDNAEIVCPHGSLTAVTTIQDGKVVRTGLHMCDECDAAFSLASSLREPSETPEATIRTTKLTIETPEGEPWKASAEMRGEAVKHVAGAMAGWLRDIDAANYGEMKLQDPTTGQMMVVTVQRLEGKTPHELRLEAEAELAELRRSALPVDTPPSAPTPTRKQVIAVLEKHMRIESASFHDQDVIRHLGHSLLDLFTAAPPVDTPSSEGIPR